MAAETVLPLRSLLAKFHQGNFVHSLDDQFRHAGSLVNYHDSGHQTLLTFRFSRRSYFAGSLSCSMLVASVMRITCLALMGFPPIVLKFSIRPLGQRTVKASACVLSLRPK